MSKTGRILIVEDDADDKEFLEAMLTEIGVKNKLVWMPDATQALAYLNTTIEPLFLIFSDINMPIVTGLDFKRQIDADPVLRKKSIPFIFYSTAALQKDVNEAYTELTIQGFFIKGSDYNKTKAIISTIVDYWKNCIHPNI